MRAPAIILAAVTCTLQPAAAAVVDVVVQAGHDGRPASCVALHVRACNLGTGYGVQLERRWTPVVADAATAALRAAGFRVARRPADYTTHDTARAAVFFHFDGSLQRCAGGASVGFPRSTDPAFVHDWERRYRALFPFRFAGENITRNEAQYYGYRNVSAAGKTMLIEFGEMTCPAQEAWLAPRLRALGRFVADFIGTELRP